jgi:hypothetical protein
MDPLHRFVSWLLPPATPPDQVSVAIANNEPQAEMMSQLLHREGIPCTYQSVGGVGLWAPWNPTGPRDIIVNAADATRAMQVLGADGHPHHAEPRRPVQRRSRRSQPKR